DVPRLKIELRPVLRRFRASRLEYDRCCHAGLPHALFRPLWAAAYLPTTIASYVRCTRPQAIRNSRLPLLRSTQPLVAKAAVRAMIVSEGDPARQTELPMCSTNVARAWHSTGREREDRMTKPALRAHPMAELVPHMTADHYSALVQDIREQ